MPQGNYVKLFVATKGLELNKVLMLLFKMLLKNQMYCENDDRA